MKIRWHSLRDQPESLFLVLDLVVMVLITIDLSWLLADTVLLGTGTGILIHDVFPDFHREYRLQFHRTFLIADAIFTGFLITELGLRWLVAVREKTYYRWFFYPFVHWYDVLGILPIPGFRVLRLLRLVSIVYRLHRLGIIDLASGGLVQLGEKYYRIVLEELSDRIVVNVINGMQQEIRTLGPTSQRLIDRIILPHRDIIIDWVATSFSEVTRQALAQHDQNMDAYLKQVVDEAFAGNADVQRLAHSLPWLGERADAELRVIVGGLLYQVMGQILADLGKSDNEAMKDVASALFDTITAPAHPMNTAMRQIVLDSLEAVKQQVAIQQWKVAEQQALAQQAQETNEPADPA